MKIVNGKGIGFYPNGTVFARISDSGLNIICGHNEDPTYLDGYYITQAGHFGAVLHMLNDVSCVRTITGSENEINDDDWNTITDTNDFDYDERDWLVVFSKEEVQRIIQNLTWALTGCEESRG